MAKNSLEKLCEDLLVQLMRSDVRLKGKTFRNSDDQRSGEMDVIVVEAVQGAHRLDGPKGFDVSVSAEYRSSTGTPEQNDLVAKAMVDSVYASPNSVLPVLEEFRDIVIMDEMTGDRSDTANSRHRKRTFPMIAVEK